MAQDAILNELPQRMARAVEHYWSTRAGQMDKQKRRGAADQGFRSAVTGGAQMDGFIQFLTALVTDAGVPESCVYRKKAVELPGFFRPTKEWDLLVVRDGELLAAIGRIPGTQYETDEADAPMLGPSMITSGHGTPRSCCRSGYSASHCPARRTQDGRLLLRRRSSRVPERAGRAGPALRCWADSGDTIRN